MTHNNIAYWNSRIQEKANLEQARHNKEAERIDELRVKVQDTYNRGQLVVRTNELLETGRHNRESEALIRAQNYATNALASATLLMNKAHLERMDAETQRANLSRESETRRSNMANLAENVRHNTANEQLTQYGNVSGRINAWSNAAKVVTSIASLIGTGTAVQMSRKLPTTNIYNIFK